ncbi:MAG: hypothetical protein Fur0021_04950 [Candidatus Promineifilaceae bacterium]
MSLLQLELNHINARFNEQWLAWQESIAVTTRYATEDSDNFWNFFPINLYEYFAGASFQAARRVALAARAGGMYGFLLQNQPIHDWSDTQMEAATTWLVNFARDQLAPCIAANAPFWQQFADSFAQCRCGFTEERQRLALPATPYPTTDLEGILQNKSALARLSTLALATLTGQTDVAQAVCASQEQLYAGIYLFHSVLNWKTDFRRGTFSYPLINLLVELPHLSITTAAEREAQLTQVGRYFYYTGWAEKALAQASDHFYRAMAAVSDLSPTLWGALLTRFLEQSESLRKDIAHLVRQRSSFRATSPNKDSKPIELSHLQNAIENAARYLSHNQAEDGRWGDFMLLAEQSTFWVTGYVGWTLSQLEKPTGRLQQAARWLIQNQFDGGGWGYNRNWPLDADSIANALLFLSTQPGVAAEEWQPALRVLLAHQGKDGGFSTIMDAEAWLVRFRSRIEDLTGWTNSHTCVTGVIGLLLAKLAQGRYHPQARQALAYLRSQQQADGSWRAYWWSGSLYSTCRAVQTMKLLAEPQDEERVTRAVAWLEQSQCADGGWSAGEKAESAPFHTAFATQALAWTARTEEEVRVLNAGINWLLQHQRADGSWDATPVLRVPAPDMRYPWLHKEWHESTIGLNVIVPDWRRLFTTATALQSLLAVQRRQQTTTPFS